MQNPRLMRNVHLFKTRVWTDWFGWFCFPYLVICARPNCPIIFDFEQTVAVIVLIKICQYYLWIIFVKALVKTISSWLYIDSNRMISIFKENLYAIAVFGRTVRKHNPEYNKGFDNPLSSRTRPFWLRKSGLPFFIQGFDLQQNFPWGFIVKSRFSTHLHFFSHELFSYSRYQK